jgi:hypothetical protein
MGTPRLGGDFVAPGKNSFLVYCEVYLFDMQQKCKKCQIIKRTNPQKDSNPKGKYLHF